MAFDILEEDLTPKVQEMPSAANGFDTNGPDIKPQLMTAPTWTQDNVAEAEILSQKLGIPSIQIASDIQKYRKQAETEDTITQLDGAPRVLEWLSKSKIHIAGGLPDVPGLADMEKVIHAGVTPMAGIKYTGESLMSKAELARVKFNDAYNVNPSQPSVMLDFDESTGELKQPSEFRVESNRSMLARNMSDARKELNEARKESGDYTFSDSFGASSFRALKKGAMSLAQSNSGFERAMWEAIGKIIPVGIVRDFADGMAENAAEKYRMMSEEIATYPEEDVNALGKIGLAVVESFPSMVEQIGMAMIGQPGAGVQKTAVKIGDDVVRWFTTLPVKDQAAIGAIAGTLVASKQIIGDVYGEARQAGAGEFQALTSALGDAALQAPLEKFGLSKIFGLYKTQGIKALGKGILESIITEFGTEWLQQWPDEFMRMVSTLGVNGIASDGVLKFIEDIPETFKSANEAGAVGAIYGGLLSAPAIRRAARHESALRQDMDFFEALDNSAKALKIREAMPRMWKDIVSAVTADAPVQNVYIDPQDLVDATKGLRQDYYSVAEQLGIDRESFDRSYELGAPIEIPLSMYQTHVAGTDLSMNLRGKVKTDPAGMTIDQMNEARIFSAKALSKALKEVAEDVESNAAMDEELSEVKAALVSSGMTEEEAVRNLDLLKARAKIAAGLWSEANGKEMTPVDWLKRLGLKVQVVGDMATSDSDGLGQAMKRSEALSLEEFKANARNGSLEYLVPDELPTAVSNALGVDDLVINMPSNYVRHLDNRHKKMADELLSDTVNVLSHADTIVQTGRTREGAPKYSCILHDNGNATIVVVALSLSKKKGDRISPITAYKNSAENIDAIVANKSSAARSSDVGGTPNLPKPQNEDEVRAFEALIESMSDESIGVNGSNGKNNTLAQNSMDTVELNAVSAKDEDSRTYMKEQMLKRGWTEHEADGLLSLVDGITDEVMEQGKRYPMMKAWQDVKLERVRDLTLGLVPVRSAFKRNGEYPVNIDLGSLCTKREAADLLNQILIDEGLGQNLGPTQLEALKDILKDAGFLTACDVCFVEAKRARMLNDANKTAYDWQSTLLAAGIDDEQVVGQPRAFTPEQRARLERMADASKANDYPYRAAFDELMPEERRRRKTRGDKGADLDAGTTSDKMAKIAKLFLEDSSLAGRLNPEMLITTRGTDFLVRTYGGHTNILATLAGMYGSATSKPLEGFTVYDALSWRKDFDRTALSDNAKALFDIGGGRSQSFTDFNPILFLDYVQMIADYEIRRLPMQVYTKVPAHPKMFGTTGMMINMSFVPAIVDGVDAEHAGLRWDSNTNTWEYAWSDDSFPEADAYELREREDFGGRVGIIGVGVSDAHIQKMLDDPRIDMVIPYHASGMPASVKLKTGLNLANDYTDVQGTKKPKSAPDFNYNEALQRLGDPRAAANEYLAWCSANKYTPKFEAFSGHENYYKLLEDFRGYDNAGRPVIQGPVRLKLAEDWKQVLDESLADRSAQQERMEGMKHDSTLMEKARKILQYQRLDGDVRDLMTKRLNSVLGKSNVRVMRKNDFLDTLEQAYAASMSVEEARARVEIFRKGDGTVYGFAQDGKIVLNENAYNANTPAHEFTHIWAKVAMAKNPKLWEEGKALLKQTAVWQEVLGDELYANIRGNEDAIASEVLSRIVGAENEEFVRRLIDPSQKMGKGKGLVAQVREWLKKLFAEVRSMFDPLDGKPLTLEEFQRMPLKTLWDETRGKEFAKVAKQVLKAETMTQAEMMAERAEMSDDPSLPQEDHEYFDAIASGDMDTVRAMVEQKAAENGFADAIPEQTKAYTVRTRPAPKKTIKVYKVFTMAPDGSPSALFVGSAEKLPQGVWLDAHDTYHFVAANGNAYIPSTKNPWTKGGTTGAAVEIPNEQVRQELIERGYLSADSKATKITALAYRPGWHAGTMPFFPQGGMRPPKGTTSNYDNIHRYNQVVFECELAYDKDYTEEAEAQPKARKKDGTLNSRAADLQYMPTDGAYYYATNPMTHGHPELGMWAISGSLKINRALTQEECDAILTKNGLKPQEWEGGELNLESLGYNGEQNDAARKTLAPITYDENGKIIPLSMRFDASNPSVLYQDNDSNTLNAGFRGTISFGKDFNENGGAIISLFKGHVDLSTFAHEIGHLFIRDIEALIQSGNAPQSLIDDHQTLLDWACEDLEGYYEKHISKVFYDGRSLDELSPRERTQAEYRIVQERIAEGWLTYLRTGKAPAPRLRGLFGRFRDWLMAIYKSLRGGGFQDINEDVAAVFDRMLATEEEIQAIEEEHRAIKEEQARIDEVGAGMLTKAEEDRLKKSRANAGEASREKTLSEALDAYFRVTGESKAIRERAKAEVDAMPIYAAQDDAIQNGGIDYSSVVALYGETTARELNKKRPGLIRKEGGIDISQVAAAHDMSADELVEGIRSSAGKKSDLAAAIKRQRAASESAIREELATRDGANPGDEAYYNDDRLTSLLLEATALQRAAGKKTSTIGSSSANREWARRMLAGMKVNDTSIARLSAAEAKQAMRVGTLLTKGKVEEAAEAKRQQAIAHAMVLEALDFRNRRSKFERQMARWRRRKITDQSAWGFKEQLMAIAQRYRIGGRDRFAPQRPQELSRLRDFMNQAFADSVFGVPPIAEWILDEQVPMGKGDRLDLTVDQYEDIMHAASVLAQGMAPEEETMISDGLNGRSLLDMVNEGVATLDGSGNVFTYKEEGTLGRVVQDKWRALFAGLDNVQYVLMAADGYDEIGRSAHKQGFHSYLFRMVKDAISRNGERYRSAKKQLDQFAKVRGEFVKRFEKEFGKRAASINGVSVPAIMAGVGRTRWTAEHIWCIARNMGNAGNLKTLHDGLQLDDDMLRRLTSILTEEEWRTIEAECNLIGASYDETDKVFRKIYGVPMPDRVQGTPFEAECSDGTVINMDGWYFPISVDGILSPEIGDKQQIEAFKDAPDFTALGPSIQRGHTHARTGTGKPTALRFAVFETALWDQWRFIELGPIVKDIDRLTRKAAWRDAFTRAFGPAYYDQLREWLKYVARPTAPKQDVIGRLEGNMRSMATTFALGLNLNTFIRQFGGYPQALPDVGFKYLWKGLAQAAFHPKAMWQEINALSPMMADRDKAFIREHRNHFVKLQQGGVEIAGHKFTREDVTEAAMSLVTLGDRMTSYPIWRGAYLKAMDMNMGKEDAIAYADNIISKTQAVSSEADINAWQRDQGVKRIFSMFMSESLRKGSRMRYWFHAMLNGKISKAEYCEHFAAETFGVAMLYLAMKSLLTSSVPDKEEVAFAVFDEVTGPLPFVNQISSVLQYNGTPSSLSSLKGLDLAAAVLSKGKKLVNNPTDSDAIAGAFAAAVDMAAFSAGTGNVRRVYKQAAEGWKEISDGKTVNPFRMFLKPFGD